MFSKVLAMTAKYGIPYFTNFLNSDLSPDDVRSMAADSGLTPESSASAVEDCLARIPSLVPSELSPSTYRALAI